MSTIEINVINAIKAGHIDEVQQVIGTYGLNYAPSWSNGYNLLREALIWHKSEIAKLLINNDAQVNIPTEVIDTPLYLAVQNNDIEVVKMLLGKKAIIDWTAEAAKGLLYNAVRKGHLEIAELLVKQGADVHWRDELQNTPLHIAVEKERKLLVKMLLKHGGNANDRNKHGKTVLLLAVEKANLEIIKDILKYQPDLNDKTNKTCADVHRRDELQNTPLHIAVEKEQKLLVKMLLKHGGNVNDRNKHGKTVLLLAVEKANLEIIKDILKYQPDLNDKTNKTCVNVALRAAAKPMPRERNRLYEKVVKILLEYGLTVDTNDANDREALLFIAIKLGHTRVVEDLLKFVNDANTIEKPLSKTRFTLLHTAVNNGSIEITELLLNKGVNINAVDRTRITPIFYAIQNDDVSMVKKLLAKGACLPKKPELIQFLTTIRSRKMFEILLDHDKETDINATDETGKTALHYMAVINLSIDCGNCRILNVGDVVELLVEKGANIEARDNKGRTPLSLAAWQGLTDVIEALFKYYADINTIDDNGQTPLYHAVDTPYHTNLNETMKFLLKHGAIIHSRDVSTGYIPLDLILHVIKMEAAKLPVLVGTGLTRGLQPKFRDDCEREVEKLKNKKLAESSVSFYDILVKDIHRLTLCAENEDIERFMASDSYKEIFPIYFDMIESKWARTMKRQALLKPSIMALKFISGYNLPNLVFTEISKYLSDLDLWNLGRVSVFNANNCNKN